MSEDDSIGGDWFGDPLQVYIGHDPRETNAYHVCEASLRKHSTIELKVQPLDLEALRARHIYMRPHAVRDGILWDEISDQPMSTAFAVSRFLVPYLTGYRGWALFCDCDFMWRADVAELVRLRDPRCAVMVVKHHYVPRAGKMDGQLNVAYERKNWSSLMLFNCAHPANKTLEPALINTVHRHMLHSFAWLRDPLIGALPFEWNWIQLDAKAVHFTHGTPDMRGHEDDDYASEWRTYL